MVIEETVYLKVSLVSGSKETDMPTAGEKDRARKEGNVSRE